MERRRIWPRVEFQQYFSTCRYIDCHTLQWMERQLALNTIPEAKDIDRRTVRENLRRSLLSPKEVVFFQME